MNDLFILTLIVCVLIGTSDLVREVLKRLLYQCMIEILESFQNFLLTMWNRNLVDIFDV